MHAGVWRIRKIQKKKELHVWAKRCMDELVKNTKSYNFYNNTGWNPPNTQLGNFRDEFAVPLDPRAPSSGTNNPSATTTSNKEETEKAEGK